MKTNKILYIVYFLLFLWSCRNELPTKGVEINSSLWENNSMEFLQSECDIRNDSLRLGGLEVVPSKYHGDTIYTIDEYFKHCFRWRLPLITYLKDSVLIRDHVQIFENYSIHKPIRFFVQVDHTKTFSFDIYNNEFRKVNEERTKEIDPIFTTNDSILCSSSSSSVPQHLHIWSTYFKDGTIQTKKVSLFD